MDSDALVKPTRIFFTFSEGKNSSINKYLGIYLVHQQFMSAKDDFLRNFAHKVTVPALQTSHYHTDAHRQATSAA